MQGFSSTVLSKTGFYRCFFALSPGKRGWGWRPTAWPFPRGGAVPGTGPLFSSRKTRVYISNADHRCAHTFLDEKRGPVPGTYRGGKESKKKNKKRTRTGMGRLCLVAVRHCEERLTKQPKAVSGRPETKADPVLWTRTLACPARCHLSTRSLPSSKRPLRHREERLDDAIQSGRLATRGDYSQVERTITP